MNYIRMMQHNAQKTKAKKRFEKASNECINSLQAIVKEYKHLKLYPPNENDEKECYTGNAAECCMPLVAAFLNADPSIDAVLARRTGCNNRTIWFWTTNPTTLQKHGKPTAMI